MGSVRFEWSRDADVVVPTRGPATIPSAEQVERVVRALEASGFTVGTPKRHLLAGAAVFVDRTVLRGPAPRRAGDGALVTDFTVRLSTSMAARDDDPAFSDVRISAQIGTPCLR